VVQVVFVRNHIQAQLAVSWPWSRTVFELWKLKIKRWGFCFKVEVVSTRFHL